MAETKRISVRALVEFTLHGEDIYPAGGTLREMQEGALGHKARQKLLGDGWQAEVPLSLTVPADDDGETELHISGRMDAFRDGDVPDIEEIKLWQRQEPPVQANPAHAAQAVCYGHMLCRTRGAAQVRILVTYVTRTGKVQGCFEEVLTAEKCSERFTALLLPYLRRMKLIRLHERARDASLRALSFPFDAYRAGQREMAVQVYTAIRQRRRLFASMPTGTGKSAAALFPALKALGEGLTGRIYYLTARTTQRQGALEAIMRMRRQPLHLWTLTLDAKEKQCPAKTMCHPDWCPRAKGHFLRDGEAIDELLREEDWSPERIRQAADKYNLCPFELSLSLAEVADLTICDYNYALDPAVHIQRIFDKLSDVTLLIDEAHHLLDRTRDMLGGMIDGGLIRRLRTSVGKSLGRKHDLYQAMTGMLRALDDLPVPEEAEEGRLDAVPQSIDEAAQTLSEAILDAQTAHIDWENTGDRLGDLTGDLLGFIRARRRESASYAWLWEGARTRRLTALALDVGSYLQETTASMRGMVCFSATMEPLADMKTLLGGDEEDACFAAPSPFPPENLLVLAERINTRYQRRTQAAELIAERIRMLENSHPGKYMVFFPSFAFLRMTAEHLTDRPYQLQRQGMTEAERTEFLAPYSAEGEPVLSLCVMGGIFSEGIDLPGRALDGVMIVGVGLPQVGLRQETLREHYEQTLGAGFRYAYQLPGMQKVAQAVGRVIRSEKDRGVAVLLDDRYFQNGYQALMPPHWRVSDGETEDVLAGFWQSD